MSKIPIENAIEAIYEALINNNDELDAHISTLKSAMTLAKVKEATFKTERLVQGNREGRKRMQSYFKKRGVKVNFS